VILPNPYKGRCVSGPKPECRDDEWYNEETNKCESHCNLGDWINPEDGKCHSKCPEGYLSIEI
jgi:hypothetical protein